MVSMLDNCCQFDNSSNVGIIVASLDRGWAIRIRFIGVVVMLFQSLTLALLSVALVYFGY
jgi:hypothetical protein